MFSPRILYWWRKWWNKQGIKAWVLNRNFNPFFTGFRLYRLFCMKIRSDMTGPHSVLGRFPFNTVFVLDGFDCITFKKKYLYLYRYFAGSFLKWSDLFFLAQEFIGPALIFPRSWLSLHMALYLLLNLSVSSFKHILL